MIISSNVCASSAVPPRFLPYDRRVFDAGGRAKPPSKPARSEGEGPVRSDDPARDASVNAAYDSIGIAFDYFRSLGMDPVAELRGALGASYMDAVVNLKFKNDAHPTEPGEFVGINGMAYGTGDGVTFGDLTQGIDTAAHELAHLISGVKLGGWFNNSKVETRAVNESISDVFGELAEAWHKSRTAGTETPPDWKMGAEAFTPGVAGDGMRAGDDPKLAHEGSNLPSHMREFNVEGRNAQGEKDPYITAPGPWNSTIGTHAAYLAWRSIGTDKLGSIWLRALDHLPRPDTFTNLTTATFADLATTTVRAATEQYRDNGITATAVRAAWRIVGVEIAETGHPTT